MWNTVLICLIPQGLGLGQFLGLTRGWHATIVSNWGLRGGMWAHSCRVLYHMTSVTTNESAWWDLFWQFAGPFNSTRLSSPSSPCKVSFVSIPFLVTIPKTPQRFSNWKTCNTPNKVNITSHNVYRFCQAHRHSLYYHHLLQLSNLWPINFMPLEVLLIYLRSPFQQRNSIGNWACF